MLSAKLVPLFLVLSLLDRSLDNSNLADDLRDGNLLQCLLKGLDSLTVLKIRLTARPSATRAIRLNVKLDSFGALPLDIVSHRLAKRLVSLHEVIIHEELVCGIEV